MCSHNIILQSDWYCEIQAPEVDSFSQYYRALSPQYFEERTWDRPRLRSQAVLLWTPNEANADLVVGQSFSLWAPANSLTKTLGRCLL